MTHQHLPDHLSAELDRLSPSQRRAVTEALRHSHDTGRPASDEAALLLIAYAAGRIDAREYARQILVSLGAAPAAPLAPEPEWSEPSAPTTRSSASVEALPKTAEPGRTFSREEAVQAYVSGHIPVEEFLRIARGA